MSLSPNALSIIQPVELTDAMLISSDVAENDYPAWATGTTYVIGDRVIVVATHKIYESLQNSNTGNNPTTSPTFWIEVGPTNRWAAFDTSVSSQTVTDGGTDPKISYVIKPNFAINAVAFLNVINASKLTIELDDPVYGIVYTKVVDFSFLPLTSDWYAWFFGQKIQPTQHVSLDLPAFTNAELKIEFEGNTNLAVGVIMFGQQQKFGLGVKYGARLGIQDYSIKQTNEFGETNLLVRAFAKRANFDLFLNDFEIDNFQNFLSSIRAKPVLWVGTNDFESTVLFGFYKNFDILISYTNAADCNLEIEGLT
jgi:hypothetical protein